MIVYLKSGEGFRRSQVVNESRCFDFGAWKAGVEATVRAITVCFMNLFFLLGAESGRAQQLVPHAAPAIPPADSQLNNYIIGPGDVLQVFVWQNPELSTSIPVRPDGKISTPLVEDIVAVGKTPSQLARDVERKLGEYIRSPQVNIIVSQPNSVFSQVKVIGEVGRPQGLPYREGLTVLDVVLAVGGLGQFSAGNRARIIRSEGPNQKEIPVRLADLLNKGDMRQNVTMQAGDVLVVPQTRF